MQKANRSLGIVFFPAYDWAISPTHPEREERLLYTQDQLLEDGLFDIPGIREYKPQLASNQDILRTHFCFPDVRTVASPSHLVSAGGAIKAAQLVLSGERERAFALVRPPGHHSMKVTHGCRGFCNINIEAVMIEWIRETYGPKRIAVVDTDCHHGDGTQDIYWHDPNVLFISLHQDGRSIYPGTGFPYECGGPKAAGRTINIPLPPGTSDEGFLHVIDNLVLPILDDFKPELIINSAGQDNHFSDPITNMNFSAQGYALLNEKLNPHIAVLEGGYAIQGALPYTNLGIALAMAGLDYSQVVEPDFNPEKLRQSKQISDYIPKLCDAVLGLYFDPPTEKDEWDLQSGFYVQTKEIPYDTDMITDTQTEWLKNCDQCSGLIKVESKSSRVPLSLGLEVPVGGCKACQDAAHALWEEANKTKRYAHIQLIDRVNKVYQTK